MINHNHPSEIKKPTVSVNDPSPGGCLKSQFSPRRRQDAKTNFIEFQFFVPLRLRGEERISDF